MQHKIYISGKVTGDKNYKVKFADAEKTLKSMGYLVVNPTNTIGRSYKEYIDLDLIQLMSCDSIYMLKDWQNSKGSRLEKKYADTVGLSVLYEDLKTVETR